MARRQDQLDIAAQPRRPFLGRRVPLENAYPGPHPRESMTPTSDRSLTR
jgi:hypothetical protein